MKRDRPSDQLTLSHLEAIPCREKLSGVRQRAVWSGLGRKRLNKHDLMTSVLVHLS